MSYSTKNIIRDLGNLPAPQYYNSTTDAYEVVQGANGATLTQLAGSSAIKGAVQNVTTGGTRQQLPNYPCREVTIKAKRTNTGSIFVGGNDVSATVYGMDLRANDSITLAVSNTNLIWLDTSVNGEGVSYVAI